MNDYLIYLCLPPYLAQWYAHECNQVHNRDKATCPRESVDFYVQIQFGRNGRRKIQVYSK